MLLLTLQIRSAANQRAAGSGVRLRGVSGRHEAKELENDRAAFRKEFEVRALYGEQLAPAEGEAGDGECEAQEENNQMETEEQGTCEENERLKVLLRQKEEETQEICKV